MKDYTTNNCCDFFWINDLLALKKNSSNNFTKKLLRNQELRIITIKNVIIFGTVVEVKQIGCKGYLYQIDDGTGVITCKHSEDQFQELVGIIESAHVDTLNETFDFQQNPNQSIQTDTSADDSIFNDKSIQIDEIIKNKKSRLKGLQSIWEDIYISFNSLIVQYDIGDSVIIQGRLYSYFNINQIYINSIRAMDIKEEIMQLMIKIRDDPQSAEGSKTIRKKCSGLVTFDNIQQLNSTFAVPGNMETPNMKDNVKSEGVIVTPNLESIITFDTFICNM